MDNEELKKSIKMNQKKKKMEDQINIDSIINIKNQIDINNIDMNNLYYQLKDEFVE